MGSTSRPAAPPESADACFAATFAIQSGPGRRYRLHNRTSKRIVIVHRDVDHGELVLPPLAERVVLGARLAPFADDLRVLRQRHQVSFRADDRPPRGPT